MNQSHFDLTFVADMMLGRLARWMRILGYDVHYENPVDDPALIDIANKEDRILLTRDTRLVKRKGVGKYLLIQNNDPLEQLVEVHHFYPAKMDRALTRCIRCNTSLIAVDKEEVREQVPEYTYLAESEFGCCPSCRRVYWKGTHYRHMIATCRARIEKTI